jgi:hypothetical protein
VHCAQCAFPPAIVPHHLIVGSFTLGAVIGCPVLALIIGFPVRGLIATSCLANAGLLFTGTFAKTYPVGMVFENVGAGVLTGAGAVTVAIATGGLIGSNTCGGNVDNVGMARITLQCARVIGLIGVASIGAGGGAGGGAGMGLNIGTPLVVALTVLIGASGTIGAGAGGSHTPVSIDGDTDGLAAITLAIAALRFAIAIV